jgi:hypothetical protein
MFLDFKYLSFFKLIIKNNVVSIMGPPYILNLMTRLWRSLTFLQVITHKLLEYLKLAKITMVVKLLIMFRMEGVLVIWLSSTTNWQCTFRPCDSYVYSTILHIGKNSILIDSCNSERYVILIWFWCIIFISRSWDLFFCFWLLVSMILARLMSPLKFCFYANGRKLVHIKF